MKIYYKKIIYFIFFIYSIIPFSGLSAVSPRVQYVYDGDTILLQNGERIRYLGINAPEMDYENQRHEFLAISAKELNEKFVLGKAVRLEPGIEKRDHYGRLLAFVYTEEGAMVNLLLVEMGLARVLTTPPNTRHRHIFVKAQQRAMDSRRGIWALPFEPKKGPYIGNKKTFRFHLPTCPYAKRIKGRNKVLFKHKRLALYQGYSPCAQCCP